MAIRPDKNKLKRKIREALLPPFHPKLIAEVFRAETGRRGKARAGKYGVVVR